MRRPPKPRITKPNLVWVWKRTQWVPFYRVTWTEGGKRRQRAIKLDWQMDAETLDQEYWRARGGKHERQVQVSKYSWRTLITEWRSDPRVQNKLSASTKKSYRTTMELILSKNADKDARKTTRKGLRTIHTALQEKTRKADKYVAVVSLLWNYAARRLEWPMGPNPAAGFDLYGAQRGFEPWPGWMVDALPTAPLNVQTAATLILNTGQRPSAAIAMQFADFDGQYMSVLDEKTDTRFEVFCPDDLQDYVRNLPRRGKYLIAKNLTEPVGYNAVEKSFRAWRKDLGKEALDFSLHGLRKLAIVNLAEAGCSDAEIQAVTNQSAEMVAYYRIRADRKRLSASAHRRRGQNKNES